ELGRQLRWRPPGLRGHRPDHLHPRPRPGPAGHHAAHPRHPAGPPLRPGGRRPLVAGPRRAHGLALIEDAAQAHRARVGGRRVGAFGRASCFSFYPGKNLGAFGEGGAVCTDDDAVAERVRRLRDHAQDARHHHVEIGFNTRMEGIQAAVLDAKLSHLEAWNAARAAHAHRYHRLLDGLPGVVLPQAPAPEAHAWHLYVIRVPGRDRDELRRALAERGVATGVHYPTPVPFQPAYAHLGHRPGDFPVAEALMRHCLSLPLYPELTAGQIEHTAAALC